MVFQRRFLTFYVLRFGALDHHLPLLWLLTLPAVTPLIQPTIPRSADGLLHLYRVVALDHALQQGALFPRWLPDLAYGYGLPLFVFYAPLAYYLTEGLHLLGLSVPIALNTSAALAMFVAATGVYLLVKDSWGPQAGLVAGLAYVYAPYQLFNLLSRGSLPAAWAGALFPFTFWAFGRLLRENWPGYLPLSAVICGLALLAHNISNLLFLPWLILYLGLELLLSRHQPASYPPRSFLPVTRFWRVGLALALGLGLAAFFLIPAIAEKEFVQIQRVITPPDFDYRSNFVSLADLFSLPPPANTGLLNPPEPLTLGLAQVGLATIGLLCHILYFRPHAPHLSPHALRFTFHVSRFRAEGPLWAFHLVIFATLGLAAALFMMLPISVGLWDRLPLIAFIQQPHRLLSLTALLLAILAGAAVAVLPGRLGFGVTLVGISLIFVTAVPLLYPGYYDPLPASPTLTGMMAYEHASGAIGTTSFGEYLPVWVRQTPRESPLEPMYQAGIAIERLDPAYLPPGSSIKAASYNFNQVDLRIDAAQPYQAIFHTFYFPGWKAWIDGQPVPVLPMSERGLIGIAVPAGSHRLQLQFSETPLRWVANSISILALIGIVFLALKVKGLTLNNPLPLPGFTRSQWIGLIGVALALCLIKILYLDRFDNPLKHNFTGTDVAGVGTSRQVNFGNQINLLGYDLDQQMVASGQAFTLTAYWQARQPLATNYSALAQLVDPHQHLYASQDNLHPGNLPTSQWQSWGFVQDQHTIPIPPGTPPGAYFLITGLYEPDTWARLPVLAGGDAGWGDTIAVPVTVVKATQTPSLAELGITWPVIGSAWETSGMRLLGATPERDFIVRSDFLRLALFWEVNQALPVDYEVNLRLLATDGTVALTEATQPSHGRYPTTSWSAGERVRDNHALWIPADFPAGIYRLQVRLLNETGQPLNEWLELGELTTKD